MGIVLALTAMLLTGPASAQLVSAVLPTTRSVPTNQPATVFATLINTHDATVDNCAPDAPRGFPGQFSYQTTDAATNQPTGIADRPVALAPGAAQSFVLVLTPVVEFDTRALEIRFRCDAVAPTNVLPGINTLRMDASVTPQPDIVALSAASAGTLRLDPETGVGAFAVASVNVGAAGSIDVSADVANRQLPVALKLCQTDSAARCINPSAPSAAPVTLTAQRFGTATFSIFAEASEAIAFDPAEHRVFVRFQDASGAPRGATSVALERPASAVQNDADRARITRQNMPTFAEALRGFAGEASLELDEFVVSLFEAQIPIFNVNDVDLLPVPCDTGLARLTVMNGGANVELRFEDCLQFGLTSNGRLQLAFSNVTGGGTDTGGYDLRVDYDDFVIASNRLAERRSGTVELRTDITDASEHRHAATLALDVQIDSDTTSHRLRAQPITLDIRHENHEEAMDWLSVTGELWIAGEGSVALEHEAGRTEPGEIRFLGAPGTEQAMTQSREGEYQLFFQPAGPYAFSAHFENRDLTGIQRFDGEAHAPERGFPRAEAMNLGETLSVELADRRSDRNADLLVATPTLTEGDARHIALSRLSATRFQVRATAAGEFVHRIELSDPGGLTTSYNWFFRVDGDTDGDGNLDRFDQDDDGDGALDLADPFPVDGTEWRDTDGDGVGDNADPDADNDGVPDSTDDYPRRADCQSHTAQPQCLQTALRQVDQIAWNDTTIFFAAFADDRIYRFSIATNRFVDAIDVRPTRDYLTSLNAMAWHPQHQRLYAGFTDGRLFALDPATFPAGEQPFFALGEPLIRLGSAGSRLLAISGIHPRLEKARAVSEDGVETQAFNLRGSRSFAFDETRQILFVVGDGLQSFNLEADGRFASPQFLNLAGNVFEQIALEPAGDRLLIGNGELYGRAALDWRDGLDGGIKAIGWKETLPLVALRKVEDTTVLKQYGTDLRVHHTATFDGEPLAVVPGDGHYLVLLRTAAGVERIVFTPTTDSDGDGVANAADAFPEDAAASIDLDSDGAPDAWLPGQDETTSSTGLMLDAFPGETGCWLPDHGRNGQCDIGLALPDYSPERVTSGTTGMIYLFDRESGYVYRYDAIGEQHLLPVRAAVGRGSSTLYPTAFGLHEQHDRLYFGFSPGWVNYSSLSDLAAPPSRFVQQSAPIGALVATGNSLLVQDFSGAWVSHFYYTESAQLLDSADFRWQSATHAYAPGQRRVYSLWDLASPIAGIRYEQLTPNGTIEAKVESNERLGQHPVVLSPDESLVLDGAGTVLTTLDLQPLTPLDHAFVDAAWNLAGELLTVRADGENALLDRYDANRNFVDTTPYAGAPLALETTPAGVVLVTEQSGKPTFTRLP